MGVTIASELTTEKESILKAARYVYNFDRMAYYNRTTKKAFAAEWIDDNDVKDLHRALAEPNDSDSWKVYAEPQPPQSVINEFLAEING
jgi:hypothetical protein